jgi:ketosteroid isomerase-like protein
VSSENVEAVRRIYDGWSRGDFSDVEVFHHDVEFEMVDWPHPVKSHGVDAMRDAWLASLGAWEDFRSLATEYVDYGQNVLVLNRIEARGKGSGAEVSADTATVFTFEAGRVVRLALYWDTASAYKAAASS